ncbi:MAG: dephospho-CoA kinase [Rikenellaceae bacterium]|jgi:dephospho-CoA kinase|nr:dephospho-CoA kinase [Rikenellaceae bacterium]
MLKVGITGGIGSGKSVICRLFSMLGVPVYDSDARAKELINSDSQLMAAITAVFGPQSYLATGLNREYVARRVFGNQAMLARLNGLVHPAVFKDFEAWAQRQQAPYVIIESAILFESGLTSRLDRTVLVDAPREVRMERAMLRDGVDRESVERRMEAQGADKPPTDHIIDNGGEAMVWPQVIAIDKELRR